MKPPDLNGRVKGGPDAVLTASGLGVGRVLLLCPTNAEAAKALWYVPAILNGTATITFHEPLPGEAAFAFSVVGAGNTKGM